MKNVLFVLLFLLGNFLSSEAKVKLVSPDYLKMMKQAKAGDTLLLQDGTYKHPIVLRGLKGTFDKPIVIMPMHNNKVKFDGTDYLNGDWKEVTPESEEGKLIQKSQWKRIKNKVYSLKLDEPIYALIYKGKLMSDARWPNANWDDPWRLDRYMVLRRADVQSQRGELYDGLATDNALEESSKWLHYDRTQCKNREEMLADLDISFTDATVVMSHTWGSWATRVTKHEAGKNNFKYDTEFTESGNIQKEAKAFLNHRIGWDKGKGKFAKCSHAGLQFFFMGLPALDVAEEWWYDKKSKTLFFVSPDNRKPAKNEMEGKRRDYQISLSDCDYVVLKGINFYGVAASILNCTNTRMEDCKFKFSASQKFSVGNHDQPVTTVFNNRNYGKDKVNYGNAIVNCQFTYLDGNAFEAKSPGMVLDNVLIYRTQQTTLGLASFTMHLIAPSLVRRVTINDVGASVGIRGGGFVSIYELNNITRFGGLQYDGAAIQSSPEEETVYRFNWSHDHPKRSFRFDTGSYPNSTNHFGEMSYNVAWNTPAGFSLKGEDLLVHNNLALGNGGFYLFNMKRWASKNENTLVANNIVSNLTAGSYDWDKPGVRKNVQTGAYEDVKDYWMKETKVGPECPTYIGKTITTFDDGTQVQGERPSPILSTQKNNYYDDPHLVLRDPKNLDFRLKDGVQLIQGGYRISTFDVPWKQFPISGSEDWEGNPCIGPYENNDNYYWIPGFKYAHASTPVPVNGTQTAKLDCDLMWLEGYKAESQLVYFGTSFEAVHNASEQSRELLEKLPMERNIVHLFKHGITLAPHTTYYWRVDQVRDNKVIKGKVWSFTTGNSYGNK